MSISNERADYSLVFADREQNYYLIPVEVFERGRVPAERKAELEETMREQEVSGYYLQVAAAAAVGFGLGLAYTGAVLAVGAAGGAVAGAAVVGAAWALSSD
jgi:hypothetical protein